MKQEGGSIIYVVQKMAALKQGKEVVTGMTLNPELYFSFDLADV